MVAAKNAPEWDILWSNDMTDPAGKRLDLYAGLDFDIVKNPALLGVAHRCDDQYEPLCHRL